MYVVGYYMNDVAIPSTLVNPHKLTRECASTAIDLIRHRVVQRAIFEAEVAILVTCEHNNILDLDDVQGREQQGQEDHNRDEH